MKLTIGSVIALCAITAGSLGASASTETVKFYVSPGGSDVWSGRLDKPNPARTDGPFATLERARDAIREIKKRQGGLNSPVSVFLRRGIYFLETPFCLTSADSGASGCPILYTAYPGEEVTISGGKPITGFKEARANGIMMLAADLPEVAAGDWRFTQLFVNGRRRSRTRLPKEGYYRVAELVDTPADVAWSTGQSKFRFNPGDIKQWAKSGDVDIVALHFWIESRMQIASVDESSRIVTLNKPSTFRLTDDHAGAGARYFLENVFEALDTPGQWYLDRAAGVLYYYPYIGEDVKNATFTAPRLQQIVRVIGNAANGRTVEHVTFSGLRFSHTEPTPLADRAGSSQAAHHVPGAIYFENATNCAVRDCEISRIGTYALEIGPGCRDIRIERNLIRDMGAGGVKVQPGSEGALISDNEIADGGKIFMSGIGVWIGNSPHNRVLHNSIHDLDYTGVSVGWVWGYGESKAIDNHVEYNHIHHVGRGVLSDLGGIYTLGISPGTRLRNNLIHDCLSHSYGGWGIYTDEGSTGILIEGNIVYRTKTGGFHQHYGKENIVRNNIFAFSKLYQLQRSRQEPHTSFTFERNIVLFNEGELLGSLWNDDHYKMDNNLYWDTSGRPLTFAGAPFEDWKKRGHDAHSLIVDPKLADPLKGDFRLSPDSPALALGFRPIDVSSVGPRGPIGPRR